MLSTLGSTEQHVFETSHGVDQLATSNAILTGDVAAHHQASQLLLLRRWIQRKHQRRRRQTRKQTWTTSQERIQQEESQQQMRARLRSRSPGPPQSPRTLSSSRPQRHKAASRAKRVADATDQSFRDLTVSEAESPPSEEENSSDVEFQPVKKSPRSGSLT